LFWLRATKLKKRKTKHISVSVKIQLPFESGNRCCLHYCISVDFLVLMVFVTWTEQGSGVIFFQIRVLRCAGRDNVSLMEAAAIMSISVFSEKGITNKL